MKDEPLDFLPMILLLGLVVSLCLKFIMPVYLSSREMTYDIMYDKTIKKVEGTQYENYADAVEQDYSYPGLIILLSTQTSFMPEPRVLNVCGVTYSVGENTNTPKTPGLDPETGAAVPFNPTDFTYTPESEVTVQTMLDTMDDWADQFTALYGINSKRMLYTVKFDTYKSETREGNLIDDCYTVCVKLRNTSTGEFEFFRCAFKGGRPVLERIHVNEEGTFILSPTLMGAGALYEFPLSNFKSATGG